MPALYRSLSKFVTSFPQELAKREDETLTVPAVRYKLTNHNLSRPPVHVTPSQSEMERIPALFEVEKMVFPRVSRRQKRKHEVFAEGVHCEREQNAC
jgi:hypothetical protein